MKDFLSINDIDNDQMATLIETADAYSKRSYKDYPLLGQSIALIFEKPSLRTFVSFDVGVQEMGGHSIYLKGEDIGLDTREPVEDIARVLERWCSFIVARVFDHKTLTRLAEASNKPIVNALSDMEHPCQALADLVTIRQHLGKLKSVVVAYIGDANNVARSLSLACAAVGAHFRIASPSGYGFSKQWIDLVNNRYSDSGDEMGIFIDPSQAVVGADVVYTDVWTSMGQEEESAKRLKAFEGYQVNIDLLAKAKPSVLLMHDMPAHYGEEIPEGMLDDPRSIAFDQAENRLHAQKAILRHLALSF